MQNDLFSPSRVYTISELNGIVRGLLETRFPNIWLEGEITNLTRPASGHMYFTLKDARAGIRCAMFRNRNLYMRFKPGDGQSVLAQGKISLYEPQGSYQFIVETMEPAGEGRLQREFEALKKRLHAEGLFDEAHKQTLPGFPARLGVITSPTGAAIRDILHVLKRRYPLLEVIIYPVSVQGEGADNGIAAAIAHADARQECDVLLISRGGGSIEDLWAFNEEVVARAIYDCATPVVSGIGHEIDFTIADFVADLRAPTPSAAAEIISPDGDKLLKVILQLQTGLKRTFPERLADLKKQARWLERSIQAHHPEQQLQTHAQRVDELEQRLRSGISHRLTQQRHAVAARENALTRVSPAEGMAQASERHRLATDRLSHLMTLQLHALQQTVEQRQGALTLLNPLNTLQRGYAIVYRQTTGAIISDAGTIHAGEVINARLANGGFSARVVDKTPNDDNSVPGSPGETRKQPE